MPFTLQEEDFTEPLASLARVTGGYWSARGIVLRGDIPAAKRNGRWFLRPADITAIQRRAATRSPHMTTPVPEGFEDINELVRKHEAAGTLQAALESELLADASEADQRGDGERAGTLRELVADLRAAVYCWDSVAARWRLTLPDGASGLAGIGQDR